MGDTGGFQDPGEQVDVGELDQFGEAGDGELGGHSLEEGDQDDAAFAAPGQALVLGARSVIFIAELTAGQRR